MKIKSLLFTTVLLAAILCSTGLVGAQNPSNADLIATLQTEIAQLTAQLQALQAQQSTTPNWCYTFNTNLRIGDTGQGVQALQTALGKEGLSSSSTDTFDEQTASAVTGFQEKYKDEVLTPLGLQYGTGFVGSATRTKLNALYGCTVNPTCSDLYWFDDTNKACQSQKQFCGAYMYYGLQTFNDQQDCLNAVTAQQSCTPNWTCGWGPCVNGSQSEVATDSNNCPSTTSSSGANIACPALARTCLIQCISENGTGEKVSGQPNNCCAGLQEQDYATTNSMPGSVMYKCIKNQCTTDIDCPQPVCTTSTNTTTCAAALVNKCVNGQCVLNTMTQSITVTSPNGGEIWAIGQNHNITWNTTGFSASDSVSISLYDSAISCAPGLAGCWTTFPIATTTNTGSYSWDTNTYYGDPGPGYPLHLSQYGSTGAVYEIKLIITSSANSTTASDSSDKYFSVVEPTASLNVPQ